MTNILAFSLEPGVVLLVAVLSLPILIKLTGDALIKLGDYAENRIEKREKQRQNAHIAEQSG